MPYLANQLPHLGSIKLPILGSIKVAMLKVVQIWQNRCSLKVTEFGLLTYLKSILQMLRQSAHIQYARDTPLKGDRLLINEFSSRLLDAADPSK